MSQLLPPEEAAAKNATKLATEKLSWLHTFQLGFAAIAGALMYIGQGIERVGLALERMSFKR